MSVKVAGFREEAVQLALEQLEHVHRVDEVTPLVHPAASSRKASLGSCISITDGVLARLAQPVRRLAGGDAGRQQPRRRLVPGDGGGQLRDGRLTALGRLGSTQRRRVRVVLPAHAIDHLVGQRRVDQPRVGADLPLVDAAMPEGLEQVGECGVELAPRRARRPGGPRDPLHRHRTPRSAPRVPNQPRQVPDALGHARRGDIAECPEDLDASLGLADSIGDPLDDLRTDGGADDDLGVGVPARALPASRRAAVLDEFGIGDRPRDPDGLPAIALPARGSRRESFS